MREGCPHCADAKAFLDRLAAERQDLQVVYHPVDTDPQACDALIALSQAAGAWPPGVPTFIVDGQMLIGFDDAEHSGRELLAMIDRAGTPKDRVETRLFGTISVSSLGLPLFTLALGLLYYLFMAAWLNVFLAVGMSNALRVALVALAIGAVNVKDFVAFGRGPSLSIPASAKPGLYARMRGILQARTLPAALLGVAALAVAVNFVELLCTAGLPAIYTSVLAQQQLDAAAHYGWSAPRSSRWAAASSPSAGRRKQIRLVRVLRREFDGRVYPCRTQGKPGPKGSRA